ncbi:MAG: endolytic transglycosylase MltG [Proteobacteria bacterium]|nr:endolytic transglycosylase MltG [Pseudomonadota bacterium]
MSSKRRFAIWTGILLFGAAIVGVYIFVIFPHSPGPGDGSVREIEIKSGIGPKRLAEVLSNAETITNPVFFAFWVRAIGGLTRVKAGKFRILDNTTPFKILNVLSGRGIHQGVRVTIPEGYTLSRIGAALQRANVVTSKAFIAAATDRSVIEDLGMPGPTAEGYLFPDTYFFDESQSVNRIIETMYENFNERLTSIEMPGKVELRRVVTIASIVQAEAQVTEEMPVIAGVFSNRLTKPEFPSRLLQADPTVSYGCEPFVKPRAKSCKAFKGTLMRSQLDDSSNPYNTYRHRGLPPGPICAPGIEALKAAAKPADVSYFYFVVKTSGRHAFSTTLKEHQRAVDQYRGRDGR